MHNEKIIFKDSKFNVFCDKKEIITIGFDMVKKTRKIIETYIQENNNFLKSFKPISIKDSDPKIIRIMKWAAIKADVGPMATVAGTLAQVFAEKMVEKGAKRCIVDNGGDAYIYGGANIGLYSKNIDRLGFKINGKMAVCSSSSNMGHSYSFGKCDLATVFSEEGALADACATACANKVKKVSDIKKTLDWVQSIDGVLGAVIIKDRNIGMIGNLPEIINVDNIKEKVTIHPLAKNQSA